MKTLHDIPSKSRKELEIEIEKMREALEDLQAELQATAQKELRSEIETCIRRLKDAGFNDNEIKDAWIRYLKITDAPTPVRSEETFETKENELCTNPKNNKEHWWSGKGGKRPRWATPEYLDKKLPGDAILKIKELYRQKRIEARRSRAASKVAAPAQGNSNIENNRDQA